MNKRQAIGAIIICMISALISETWGSAAGICFTFGIIGGMLSVPVLELWQADAGKQALAAGEGEKAE